MAFPRSSLGDEDRNKRATCGLIKAQQSSIQEGQYKNHPKLDDAEEGEETKQNCQRSRAGLSKYQKAALIKTIGDAAADERKKKECQCLGKRDCAQGECRSVGDF